MNIILLSGGSGKRLWPLSNDVRSKQFIKIFKRDDSSDNDESSPSDEYESMVQRIYRQIMNADSNSVVTIATSKSQVSVIRNQLGNDVGISIEPYRRDTLAAIILASSYLHELKGVPEDEAVVVCPVDPYVSDTYFVCIKELYERAYKGNKNLVLMGIEPTYPSEKYGYIISNKDGSYSFKEKPSLEKARELLNAGALWNGGVFGFKLSYVLRKSREIFGTDKYESLYEKYGELKKISFDYEVVENEKNIDVIKYSGEWKDLGTWNTLTEAMEENVIGDARINDKCTNVHVINELGIPILGMGLRDMVISASPQGILVSDKEQSSYIKPFVDEINQQIMFAEKSWGSYRVLDVGDESLTVKVTLNPGHKMNYHSHEHRSENWTVVKGNGIAIIDGEKKNIKAGDYVFLPIGCKHTVIACENELQIIENQLGSDINVEDKKKYDMPF